MNFGTHERMGKLKRAFILKKQIAEYYRLIRVLKKELEWEER